MLLNEWVYQSKYQEYEIKDVYVYIQSAETNAVTDPKQTNKQTNKHMQQCGNANGCTHQSNCMAMT